MCNVGEGELGRICCCRSLLLQVLTIHLIAANISDLYPLPPPPRPPIPALLAVGAVHHHLIKTGLRSDTSIVVDTLSCYSTHHAAMLIGYGAHAICPHLAYETCRQWRASSRTVSLIKAGKVCGHQGGVLEVNTEVV